MKTKNIKLSEYAKEKNITYRTAWTHFKEGLIEDAYKDNTGHVYVPKHVKEINNNAIVYAREQSIEKKDDLIEQQKRLEEFVQLKGYDLYKSYKEIGSGMNDNRTILNKIFNDDNWKYLIIENKDRLTRFGYNNIKNLLNKLDKEIIVLNSTDNDNDDKIKDLVNIIQLFSVKLFGLRRKKNKEDIIKFLES